MAEVNDSEEIIPQPKPFPPEMVDEPEKKAVGHQVRDYLWGKGPIDYQIVTSNMNRQLVVEFVGFEIPDLPPQFFWRARILADLYHLIEHLGFFQSTLNRGEKEPVDLDRSIASTIILNEIGDEGQKDLSVQYYEYLTAHPLSKEKFHELIKCLASLGERASARPLRSRMEQEIKALATRENEDPEAGIEKREIEDLVENQFFFIEEANESRKRILGIEDIGQRLRTLIEAYLQLTEDGGGEYFALWVQQQIRRIAESQDAQTVIDAFRKMAQDSSKLSGSDMNFCLVRCYNAIEYFEGELTADELAFMKKKKSIQIDPLRFMPLTQHIHPIEDPEPEDEIDEDEEETVE